MPLGAYTFSRGPQKSRTINDSKIDVKVTLVKPEISVKVVFIKPTITVKVEVPQI